MKKTTFIAWVRYDRRPDLLARAVLSKEDREFIKSLA